MMRDQARAFLTKECSGTVVRAALDGDAKIAPRLWQAISDLGWPSARIPESLGGLGLGYLELCVLAEELGRALAPVPFASTIYLAAELLLEGGSDAQQQRWLPEIAAGTRIATLAYAERPGVLDATRCDTRLRAGRLYGTKSVVADGLSADLAVVVARDESGAVQCCLVELDQPAVRREALCCLDASKPHARLSFDGAEAEPLHGGAALLARVLDRAAVFYAFEQLGGAERCLEMAVGHARERQAFGRAIGSFQAIKHKLADMYVAKELTRSNCYYAAWALASDAPELPVAAATARVGASQAYLHCAKENIQAHGGIGFTWELDAHLHYRRAKVLGLAIGSEIEWKRRLVQRTAAQYGMH